MQFPRPVVRPLNVGPEREPIGSAVQFDPIERTEALATGFDSIATSIERISRVASRVPWWLWVICGALAVNYGLSQANGRPAGPPK